MRGPAAALIAALIVAMLAACSESAGTTGASPSAPSGATSVPTATQTAPPTAEAAAPTPVPTAPVLQDGPLAFRVCAALSWTRPTIAAMAEAFTNPRFGGPPRPAPELYGLYLAKVLRLYPRAVSANIEAIAMSGWTSDRGTRSPECDGLDEDLGKLFERLWLFELEPLSMRRDGSVMTVVAKPAPNTARDVIFPDPPVVHEGSRGRADTAFYAQELKVIDESGRLVAYERLGQMVQYSGDGRLLFATSNLQREPAMSFIVTGSPLTIAAYTAAGRFEPGTVRILDASGRDAATLAPGTPPAGWDEVLRATLPPGVYTVTAINKEPQRGGGVLVVPASTPLP